MHQREQEPLLAGVAFLERRVSGGKFSTDTVARLGA